MKSPGKKILTSASTLTLIALLLLADPTRAAGPIPGRFVVKLATESSRSAVAAALSPDQRLESFSQIQVDPALKESDGWRRVCTIDVSDQSLTADDILDLIGAENVEYVEPVYELEFFGYPAEPYFSQQWHLQNTGQACWAVERVDGDYNDLLILHSGTAGSDINLSPLYQTPPASATKVVVAVVDTGVDPNHPELRDQLWRNPDEIAGNGLDDDHNGFVDDTIGYDVSGDTISVLNVVGDADPTDNLGHGTHIAGIIAAAENGQGIVGVAPNAEIMCIKIRPNGTTTVGAAGIVYAVNSGAKVINLSWGTPFESLILLDAIRFARNNGVLVCVSTGNTGQAQYFYPAAFSEVLAVGAGDPEGRVTLFSTYGPHVDIVAPGQNILSLRATGLDMYAQYKEPGVHIVGADSLYYLADGTSMSAPMVAGAAALIWSVRPQLTLDQVISDLKAGARDLIDPWGAGDTLPGPDSISGHGYLDIARSLEITRLGGMYFTSPETNSRYTNQVQIKAVAIGGYTGSWTLHCSLDSDPTNWQLLASGTHPPTDSLLYTLTDPRFTGHVTFRISDSYGTSRFESAVFIIGRQLQLTSPEAGTSIDYNVPISGTVFGTDYQSAAIYSRMDGGPRELLYETSGEYFDSLIYSWNASGVELGPYTIYFEGYFQSGTLVDSVSFTLSSAFAQGWPQNLTGRGGLSATTADLNNDGLKEVIVGTLFGLNVFHSDGKLMDGFPTLYGSAVRGIPAIYDVDRDGFGDIICSSDSGLHVFNRNGEYVPGWPKPLLLGRWGYGSPNPTVTRLNPDLDTAIVVLDDIGQILAFDFDGHARHYAFDSSGWFASFNQQPSFAEYFNGNGQSAADLDGNGTRELVVSYAAVSGYSGVGVFNARDGQPTYGPLPYVIHAIDVYGTVLADLGGDGLQEIVTSGRDTSGIPTIWAVTRGTQNVSGWPRVLPEVNDWLGSYPMVADLDLDGRPEVLATFYEYDIAVLYIFRSDGSPYVNVEGRPAGEAFRYAATFGTPIVANLLGDRYPEIVVRSGYLFPGTGREKIHILDHTVTPIPGWPISTPTDPSRVFSTPYSPMIDDIDGDGLVEMVLVSEGICVYVWDFEAEYDSTSAGRVMMDNLNSGIYSGPSIPTDAPDDPPAVLPREFSLQQNYPNPFNPSTAITFELPVKTVTRLDVFNVLGQTVATLVDQILPAGSHTIEFNGSEYASGVYFYRLQAGGQESTRKMVLLK